MKLWGPLGAFALLMSALPVQAAVVSPEARAAGNTHLAQVRAVQKGLSVTAPHKKPVKGRAKMPLDNRYALQTKNQQRASLGFRDGTVLHMNQLTSLVLQSPHLTRLVKGEVVEELAPGTDHQVQTAAATASAIGTEFDGRWGGGTSRYIVVEGALLVKNKYGSVLVKANQETTVKKGHAPTPPQPVDAQAAVAWTKSLPGANLGQNVALDANGGSVAAVTSQDAAHPAENAIDGRLDTHWQTASGDVVGQSITLAFPGTKIYDISQVMINPAGSPASTDLKGFDLRISTNSTDGADFRTVFSGTAKQTNELQRFRLGQPQPARYLQLIPRTNDGSAAAISVTEIEVVGVPDTQPHVNQASGIAIDPKGNVDVAQIGSGLIQRLTPAGDLLATIGANGHNPGELSTPAGLGVDPSGNIYAVSAHDSRIVKYDSAGHFLLGWGSNGSGPGQFANPQSLAVDAQGNVYVADSNNARIEKFSSTGQYLATFGARYNPWQYGPTAIALDPQGNLYVTADGDHIDKLSPSGQPIDRFGSSGKGDGQFVGAQGIALDQQGNMYVADSQNNRVEVLSPSGQYLRQWTTTGGASSSPERPQYLAVGKDGNVFVTFGAYGSTVNKYSPSGQLLASWK